MTADDLNKLLSIVIGLLSGGGLSALLSYRIARRKEPLEQQDAADASKMRAIEIMQSAMDAVSARVESLEQERERDQARMQTLESEVQKLKDERDETVREVRRLTAVVKAWEAWWARNFPNKPFPVS